MSRLFPSKTPDLPSLPRSAPSYTPFLLGLALVGCGLALRRSDPAPLRLPEPGGAPEARKARSGRDAARVARDGIARFIPSNLTGSLGRTLILMGGATIAVRALDELVDDDQAEY
ncbi:MULTISPECIES: hypothetical protein [unclassified Roseivivax]|uniref:hypothetical protein n=1 Tax=Roseivivax sp. GX 12232 TaxID=2900547 RepID=UPI001E56B581|nr:hypothetical protein [Roseivivax sp. GX 12232]MCE0505550.1 hypothetical protein [Roseivivax sp. GX 12232]